MDANNVNTTHWILDWWCDTAIPCIPSVDEYAAITKPA